MSITPAWPNMILIRDIRLTSPSCASGRQKCNKSPSPLSRMTLGALGRLTSPRILAHIRA